MERWQSDPQGISPAEYLEARLRFEPELVWLVATNGTVADFARLQKCLAHAEAARNAEEFERCDAAFHRAVAESTHNTLAIALYDMIEGIRGHPALWGVLRQRDQTPDHRQIYQREHRDIVAALQQRDASRAREIVSQHIRSTRRRLLDY